MNDQYEYAGLPLTPKKAQKLIVELFTGQTTQRQEIIERVDQVHLERGGQPARAITHPAERSLSTMKRSGLAENPRHGFWFIPSTATEGSSEHPETTEPPLIKTLSEFLKWASRFDSKESSPKYLFRGVPNTNYRIDASAYRRVKKGGDRGESADEEFERFLQLNRDLIKEARFRGHDRKNGRELEDLEVLAEFQHYEAATCLIDFTYNPLVALWFACKQESDNASKGCCKCSQKCCLCEQKSKASPVHGRVVAVRPNDSTEFREITLKLLKKEIDHFFQGNKNSTRKRLYQWQPRQQNNRIIAQQSIFLFGVPEINPEPDKECVIDGSSKEKIRESLKQIYGITEDMLFPDFDGFAMQHNQGIPYTERTFSQYMEDGERAYQRQEYNSAITDFDKAIGRDPDRAEAYYRRGLANTKEEKYQEAITDFDRAIDRDSDHTEAYYNRGLAKYQLEQHGEAVTDFDRAIDRNRDHTEAYYNRGRVNARLQRYEAAAEDYDEAIRRGLNTTEVYYNRGLVNARLQEYETAFEDYDEAIRLDPNNAEIYYQRGTVFAALEIYEGALEDYDEAIRRGLNTAEVYYNRGIMSALLQEYEGALEDYDEAIRRGLNTAEVYYNRGGMLFQLGEFDAAEQDLRTALQLARQADDGRLVADIEQYVNDMNLDIGETQ